MNDADLYRVIRVMRANIRREWIVGGVNRFRNLKLFILKLFTISMVTSGLVDDLGLVDISNKMLLGFVGRYQIFK